MNIKSNSNQCSENNPKRKNSTAWGTRHVQAVLMFLGAVFCYCIRVNISAAIVPMSQKASRNGSIPSYDWNPKVKSVILSSFLWGYVIGQLPGGLLAKRFGPKLVFGGSTAISAILTILHPQLTEIGGWKLLCIVRTTLGFLQGVLCPCIHSLLAKWVPPSERGFIGTAVYSGSQFGAAIILMVSGVIFNSKIGWPGIFYISGGIAFLWAAVFLIYGADTPAQSKVISREEREFIENSTGDSNNTPKNLPVPWRSIFTSLPFFGLLVAHCGFSWGFFTLLSEIPTYLNGVLKLNLKANGVLSALPYFTMWLVGLAISPISDLLINRRVVSVTTARKLFNTLGEWVPMICLLALPFTSQSQQVLAGILLTIAVGFSAAAFCGYLVNHMDLAPNFAGVLISLTNTMAIFVSAFGPLVVGAIVKNEENPYEWRIIFFITAAIYLVCNTMFLLFGKATKQSWNEPVQNASHQEVIGI